jgi:hypothetical protein
MKSNNCHLTTAALRDSSSQGIEYLIHDGFHKSFGIGFDCHEYSKAIRIVKSVLKDLY